MAEAQPRWGYHELADPYAAKLVAAAGVQPGDLVVDLGAGTGAITRHLVARNAHVIAVELHPARANRLRATFHDGRCVVVERDLLTWRPPGRRYRVVANPPFALITGLLRQMTAPNSSLVSADLIVPAYVAARWARGGASSRYEATIRSRLPACAFTPAATQPTAVLRLTATNPPHAKERRRRR